ncbi:MAG TPA: pitrilysin family protein [Blastocatellia bacterium]|nr:pitrilysin family protein [Blastocatellia bacterium]
MTTSLSATPASSLTSGVRRTKLSNGLTILTKEVHTKPIVSCIIWYRVGSRNEELGQTGKSHFLEHMMFKGTEKFAKGAIDLITLRNGGANNAFTSNDFTAYYFNFASDRWETALEIEASRMRETLFDVKEFESEKSVVIEELQIGLDSPWGALSQEVDAAAFKQHPYHNPIVGWIQDLKDATAAEMKGYYDKWYHPRNATLVLVGDFDTETALPKIEELFGSIPPGPEPPPMLIREEPQRGERRVTVKKETTAERLMIAYHAPEIAHVDSYALQVVSTILSTGKTSRLYQRLQEKDESVTSAGASYDEATDPTLFSIRAEIKPGHTLADVETAIYEEIDKLKNNPIDQKEMDKAKQLIEARFILGNEELSNQSILLGLFETIDKYEYLSDYLDRIKAVTPEDIQRVTKQYLHQDNRTVGQLISDKSNPDLGGDSESDDDELQTAAERAFGKGEAANMLRNAAFRLDSKTNPLVANDSRAKSEAKVEVERLVLPNGLVLLLSENNTIPGISVNLVVGAGSRYEPDDKAGVASMLGEMIDEGTTTRSAHDIAMEIESVGGSLVTTGGYMQSGINATVLSKDVELALDLVSDILLNPTFPEDRVRQKVNKRVAQIKSRADQPRVVAADAFSEIIYAGHPSHRPSIGYAGTVAGLTRQDIVDFYHRYYAPNNSMLAIVGEYDRDRLIDLVNEQFSGWKRNDNLDLPAIPEIERQKAPASRFIYMDKSQVNIYIGHLGIKRNNPDFYSLLVLDTILGSSPGFTSRIPRILRDEQGLAYTVVSNITSSASWDPGRFFAYIGTSPDNMIRAIDGLRNEIKRIVEEPVEEYELEDAKSYLTGSFVFEFETNSHIAGFLIQAETFDLGFDYLRQYPELINAVTVEDIQRVARLYIDPVNLTTVVAGPVDESGNLKTSK